MNLAKQHLDIGLFSTKRDEQLAFWQQTVGLAYDHMGKLGGGMQQHRHHMNGSILKMNHSRDPLPAAPPSGIVGLQIAREGLGAAAGAGRSRRQQGDAGPQGPATACRASPSCSGSTIPTQHDRFWTQAMQFERAGEGRYRCGDSLVVVAEQGKVERSTRVARAGLSLHDGAGLGLHRRI